MYPKHTLLFLFLCLLQLLLVESRASWLSTKACPKKDQNPTAMRSIGVIIDQRSRAGKEQKVAMEMAANDLRHCSNLMLHFKDNNSHANSTTSTSDAIELISHKQVDVILGTMTPQEAELISQLENQTNSMIPIISISPSSTSTKFPSFIQMSTHTIYQTQCIAAIVKHFKWRKVLSIHERCDTLSYDNQLINLLSDSLQDVGSSVESHKEFPCVSSILDPGSSIEKEMKKLKSSNVKVFLVSQSSLEFSKILFEKANALGMTGKGYVWIVMDEVADFLDSVDVSVLLNMQGVIGLKMDFIDASDYFREFKTKFRRKIVSEFPGEEESSIPSIYALRAYDAIWTVAMALYKREGKIDSKELTNCILSSDFEGLSGKISFKQNLLSQKPIFRVVNVIGRGYKEVESWSPEHGFLKDLNILDNKGRLGSGLIGGLNSISWPGGAPIVPKGLTFGNNGTPLRIAVPARGAFTQFVKVEFDPDLNRTLISGFSIDVFEAAVKVLPYELYYQLVPFEGSYDEMVYAVHNKIFDGAVGDTEIMADRFAAAGFTHPYIESGLVMVVTVDAGLQDLFGMVLHAFTMKMWIKLVALSLSSGTIIWCSEYAAGNDKFKHDQSLLKTIGSILWLSLTIPYLATREDIETFVSRFVAIVWIGIVIVVAATFTAVLSSNMTVPRLQPSVQSIEYLQKTNATVGCNGNSFIVRYLVDVLKFKPKNVVKINSISEYPNAFRNGEIKAAFFVAPHAKVFLAEYCEGYTISGSRYTLGGFGFVFPKGSILANDISEAILKVTQSGIVNKLEKEMLLSFSSCPNPSSKVSDAPQIHWKLLCILAAFHFAISVYLVKRSWVRIKKVLEEALLFIRMFLSGVVERFTHLGAALIAGNNVVAHRNIPCSISVQLAVNP